MSFQVRVTPPDVPGIVIAREIAKKLEDVSLEILGGVTPDRYQAYQARYQVLLELMNFMEERSAALEKGDVLEDD